MAQRFTKDPDAVLDYVFDFAAATNGTGSTNYLESGETISTAIIAPDAGITVDSSSITDSNTSVTVWLSGGTIDSEYDVTCRINTSANRTDDRTITISVKQK